MAPKAEFHDRGSHTAALTDQDSREFFDRLDGFYDSLTEKEKVMLAVMVVDAIGGNDEFPASDAPAPMEPPTDAELDAFAEKLNDFHDRLPGDQHLLVDEILAKTWFKDEAEVGGYHWRVLDQRQVPNNRFDAYRRACRAAGGDRVLFVRTVGRPYATLACWDWTHNN